MPVAPTLCMSMASRMTSVAICVVVPGVIVTFAAAADEALRLPFYVALTIGALLLNSGLLIFFWRGGGRLTDREAAPMQVRKPSPQEMRGAIARLHSVMWSIPNGHGRTRTERRDDREAAHSSR